MDIGLAVGGAFLSSALQVLFDRLTPQCDFLNLFRGRRQDQRLLKKLHTNLLALRGVVYHIESQQICDDDIRTWLNQLQDAVDTADNLLDEINYEVVRVKLGEETSQEVLFCYLDSMMPKLEETIETLEDLEKQIHYLGLKAQLVTGKKDSPKRLPSTSLVDESGVFGRHEELEEIISQLLSSDDAQGQGPCDVIPIVGLGGMGKTTLARAVYNDQRIKHHFDITAWVCVSEEYDAFRITTTLLGEIGSLDSKVSVNNLNQLQIKLSHKLKGKKFLFVLDDVWNESYTDWDELRCPFVHGRKGSRIILTTRKESVAMMMGSEMILLKSLSEEDCWSLFKTHSFENRDPNEYPELEVVGKQIVGKCKGVPLAVKTLAGLLRSKSKIEEWERLLRSEIWELPSDILPVLKLSYNDLSPVLKRCFAYCALFPKDRPFGSDEVVQLWIANGLITQGESDETIEDTGNQCFLELRSRSLFQKASDFSLLKWEAREGFLMHDLVNDLAQVVSAKLCLRLEDYPRPHIMRRVRHLSYLRDCYGEFEKFKSLSGHEYLRTLIPIRINLYSFLSKKVVYNILPTLTSLRALSLSGYQNHEFPDALFINLKHLRYLDFSRTKITKLPDSVCTLYNMQTLLLLNCWGLVELPLQMGRLINLRHLDIRGTGISWNIPLQKSKLQILLLSYSTRFVVGACNNSRIEELGELQNLHGSLSISELQNVVNGREAIKGNMKDKKHLEELSLSWSGMNADDSQTEREILDKLKPDKNIKKLEINGYRGTKFPDWFGDHSFSKLVSLHLRKCRDCDSLPALGQLPSLKHLSVSGMHRILQLTREFYGSVSSVPPFRSLTSLVFKQMPELTEWHVLENGSFPQLKDLDIINCPKLIGELPKSLPFLATLRISGCPKLGVLLDGQVAMFGIHLSGIRQNFMSLQKLRISDMPNLVELPSEICGLTNLGELRISNCASLEIIRIQEMQHLLELVIRNCPALMSLTILSLPITLGKMHISQCGKLELEFPENSITGSCCNMFLEELRLENCDSLRHLSFGFFPRVHTLMVYSCRHLQTLSFPDGIDTLEVERCGNLKAITVPKGIHLKFLHSMKISACDSLSSFPKKLAAPSLKYLWVYDCQKLKALPHHMHELLPSLKNLWISNCPEIESFPNGGLPSNIEILDISSCQNLINGREEWGLQRLPYLRCFRIYGSDETSILDESWKLPHSIQTITIEGLPHLKTLSGKALEGFKYLEVLEIKHCPQLQSLPEEGLQGLTSLATLEIEGCGQLKSLPEVKLPSSLSVLKISSCLQFQSLPENGLPSSVCRVEINDCPLLTPRLHNKKEEDWLKIAGIHTVLIDYDEVV
ncbi:putative disease resistance RPP13-like protein 1 [Solanum dulcamara]|uniref:putative disease resistance RPP13-like protein 1 n=1 Tax=Solanum dulcamara TaxID=45834 RepID=UPI0024869051|nr:putative disease resistance RPP13-like protein 1 [Solanum dulcamara]XP_055820170.1 putative disease resistance RPP13-like protein 1 [Solanum dulcamara]XP_055820171.1 putative disease resistance RPP13-like protein 1 [Solanum dulcamara]XP_055820172.1 putative disease resistance RPP13-like protein 1 [Solanum dulcamara]